MVEERILERDSTETSSKLIERGVEWTRALSDRGALLIAAALIDDP